MARQNRSAGAVALVTGANRGIGLEYVLELVDRGAVKVYAGMRAGSAVPPALEGLPVEVLHLDVTDPGSVAAAAHHCLDVTHLVNNAGLFANDRLVFAEDADAARREMEVNYFGVLKMTRLFAPVLAANGGGAITNVLSVAGAYPAPMMGGYSPAKAAALFLTTITRAELAEQRTTVTALIVGSVDTRMSAHVVGHKASPRDIARAGLDAVDRGDAVADTDPMAVSARASYALDPARYERGMARLLSAGTIRTGR
jgi:NAD(P)-dependent dehydrogenase (short-subunit alcohol dehydrogenase family)